MAHNQSHFAYALCLATAEENKRLGADIVSKPMIGTRSRAEMMNLKIIHKSITSILAEDAKRYEMVETELELLGQPYTAKIYYEITEELSVLHAYVNDIDILPLFKPKDIEVLEQYVQEELEYQKTQMQIDLQEGNDGITD